MNKPISPNDLIENLIADMIKVPELPEAAEDRQQGRAPVGAVNALGPLEEHGPDAFDAAASEDAPDEASDRRSALTSVDTSITLASADAPASDFSLSGIGTMSVIRGNDDDNDLGSHSSTTSNAIYGGIGFDVLRGGTANDQLFGEDDNDVLMGWQGSDLIDGGEGYDTVSYETETGNAGVVINLTDAAWTYGGTTYQAMTGTDTWGNLDTYAGIEIVKGSIHNDVISAPSSQEVVLYGLGGNDTLQGGATMNPSNVMLIGGEGDDTFINGIVVYEGMESVNIDLLAGIATGHGNDTLSGIYHVIGGEGNDVLKGGIFRSTLDGSTGDDIIHVGVGGSVVYALDGNDTVYGGLHENDWVHGNGNTALHYDNLVGQTVGGTYHPAFIHANLGTGIINKYTTFSGTSSRLGSDTTFRIKELWGTHYNDFLTGSTGNDKLLGLGGDDDIAGSLGNDSLEGGDGNDTIDGGGDHDLLLGGRGDDSILGGVGYDTLNGGTGNDTMIGGTGNDVYYVDDLGDMTTELDGTTGGTDTVYVSVRNFDGRKLSNIENIILVGEGSILDENAAPEIGGAPVPVTITVGDNELATPFANVTISDDNPTVTVTIKLDTAGEGYIENVGSGIFSNDTGTYVVSGDVATVQATIQALRFNPIDRPNQVVGSVQTTTFTITVNDGKTATANGNISVDSVVSNRAPMLYASSATFTIADNENDILVSPFVNVIVNEINVGDIVTATISLDTIGKGMLVPTNGGVFDAATGMFSVTGTEDEVMAAINALRYNPTDRVGAAEGSVEITTFTIVITDAGGLSATSSGTIKVESLHLANQAPTAPVLTGEPIVETASAGTLVGTLSASDPDGDALTFTFADAMADSNGRISSDGRFEIVSGSIVVRDTSLIQVLENTTWTYDVLALDGQGNSSSGAVRITVLNHNPNRAPTAPVLSGGSIAETAAAGALVGTLSASDPDGDALTFAFANAMAGSNGTISADGRFEIINGAVRVKDASLLPVSQNTTLTYDVVTSDGHGGTASGAVAITILDQNPNSAPTNIRLSSTTVREHSAIGSVIGTLSASDANGDAITYTLLNDGGGLVEIVNGRLRVKDSTKIDFEQRSSFTINVAASDGTATTTKSFTIKIEDVRQENVTGTAAGDLIRGGRGDDRFNGAAGDDTLSGGADEDVLIGGTGADSFLFDAQLSRSNADLIRDFSTAQGDKILLSRAIFDSFRASDVGMLDADAFVVGRSAQDAEDRIIYDQATGRIYYGGRRSADPILIATLDNSGTKPTLTHASFFIV